MLSKKLIEKLPTANQLCRTAQENLVLPAHSLIRTGRMHPYRGLGPLCRNRSHR